MTRGYVLVVVFMLMGMAVIPTVPTSDADGASCNPPWNRPDGLLILQEGTGGQFLVEDCGKRPFIHYLDLASHRLGPYATASTEEATTLGTGITIRAREGVLFRYPPGNGSLYIIDETGPGQYQKRWVHTSGLSQWFASCPGYLQQAIIEVSDPNFLSGYATGPTLYSSSPRPDGQLIYSGSGTQYLLVNGSKRPFPSAQALVSYDFAQPVCTANLSLYPTGAYIWAREGTLFKSESSGVQYLIERQPTQSYKRSITSLDSLTFYALQLKTLHTWPDAEVAGYYDTTHVHPVKSTWLDVWNKSLVTNDLGAHAQYEGQAVPGSWDTAIGFAEADWNNGPIAPDFFNDLVQPYDVIIRVRDFGAPWGGQADLLRDAQGTVSAVIVKLDWLDAPGGSQGVAAHELGHALLLAHDGLYPDNNGDGVDERDFECASQSLATPVPTRVPQTVMDYDCYLSFGIAGPVNWDFCGVNHKHQTGAWTGC